MAETSATGGQREFRGGAPDAAAILQLFSKKHAFLGIVWTKFRVFKWFNKVLMRPQGFRPGARAPTYLSSAKANTVYIAERKSKHSTFAVVDYTILTLKVGCIAFQCRL